MLTICPVCKTSVPRKDCHRNRYKEYVCRACVSEGARFTWGGRFSHRWRSVAVIFWVSLALVALIVLMIWMYNVAMDTQQIKMPETSWNS